MSDKGNQTSSKSLSILRQCLRYSISTIVYHRHRTTDSVNVNANANANTNACAGANVDVSVETSTNTNVDPDSDAASQKMSPFTEKDYCGIKGLKYMDAVANDGTVIDENGK